MRNVMVAKEKPEKDALIGPLEGESVPLKVENEDQKSDPLVKE